VDAWGSIAEPKEHCIHERELGGSHNVAAVLLVAFGFGEAAASDVDAVCRVPRGLDQMPTRHIGAGRNAPAPSKTSTFSNGMIEPSRLLSLLS
jgi:hypothetical protein